MACYYLSASEYEEKVQKSNVPVILDFFANWCGPCRMLAPTLEQISEEYDGEVAIFKVDVDEEPELADKFGVSAIPMLAYVRNGEVYDTLTGYRSKEEIVAKINE